MPRHGLTIRILLLMTMLPWSNSAFPLSPTPEWNCCQRQGEIGDQCRKKLGLTTEKCEAANRGFLRAQEGWEAMNALVQKKEMPASYLIDSEGNSVSSGAGAKVEREMKDVR